MTLDPKLVASKGLLKDQQRRIPKESIQIHQNVLPKNEFLRVVVREKRMDFRSRQIQPIAILNISGITTAVTEPPRKNYDFKKRVLGGFGRVGCSLSSLGRGLCLTVATSFLSVVSQYYDRSRLYVQPLSEPDMPR